MPGKYTIAVPVIRDDITMREIRLLFSELDIYLKDNLFSEKRDYFEEYTNRSGEYLFVKSGHNTNEFTTIVSQLTLQFFDEIRGLLYFRYPSDKPLGETLAGMFKEIITNRMATEEKGSVNTLLFTFQTMLALNFCGISFAFSFLKNTAFNMVDNLKDGTEDEFAEKFSQQIVDFCEKYAFLNCFRELPSKEDLLAVIKKNLDQWTDPPKDEDDHFNRRQNTIYPCLLHVMSKEARKDAVLLLRKEEKQDQGSNRLSKCWFMNSIEGDDQEEVVEEEKVD